MNNIFLKKGKNIIIINYIYYFKISLKIIQQINIIILFLIYYTLIIE